MIRLSSRVITLLLVVVLVIPSLAMAMSMEQIQTTCLPPSGNGTAGTIAVNYTFTGAPGTSALVTNVGTSTAALLDFTIPSGLTGAAGANGTAGPAGINGTDGAPGSPGTPGTPGTPGADGIAATITVGTVSSGTPASVTNVGNTTAAIFDFVIPPGATGPAGVNGTDGTIPDSSQFLFLNGTRPMTGNLSMGTNYINGVIDPSQPQDVATKKYVDDVNASMVTGTFTSTYPLSLNNIRQVIGGNLAMTLVNDIGGTINEVSTNTTLQDNNSSVPTSGAIKAYVDSKVIPGINGTNATVAINSTITGLPGTPANVTNIGNETNVLLDVTIPQGLTGDTGATGATGGTGGQILYFRHAASTDPITYETLFPVPAGSTEDDESATVSSGTGQVLIDSYVTEIGYPALTQLPAGLWRFRTFHYVSNANGNTNAVFKVYNRTAGGTETLLFTATSEDINDLATGEYLTSYVQTTAYAVSLTDRIVVKVYGQSDSGSSRTFHFVYEGSTHTSHIQTTLESAPATSLSFSVIAGETLYKGQAVYISGASGGNPQVMKADNTVTAKSRVVGLMVDNTASGATGQVRRSGALTSVDSRSTNTNINPLGQTWAAGDLLFATTGGGLTNVRPVSGRSVKGAYSLTGSSATDSLLAYPMENPVWTTAAADEDIVLRVGDVNGVNKASFRDYYNTEVAYVNSIGGSLFGGPMNLTGNLITNVSDPVSDQDAATKYYVDSHSSSLTSCTNISAAYPIGSVYVSTLATDPKTTFGCGCWTSLGTGYYLVGVP